MPPDEWNESWALVYLCVNNGPTCILKIQKCAREIYVNMVEIVNPS